MTKEPPKTKSQRGSARRAHLAAGRGAEWRPRPSRFEDRRHEADRRACRTPPRPEDAPVEDAPVEDATAEE